MNGQRRVVTAKLPDDLFARLDQVARRIDRRKDWIIRQALSNWLADEQRRHDLTLEALESVDAGHTLSQEEVEAWIEKRRYERHAGT